MLSAVAQFAQSAGGLEKSLRVCQGLALVAVGTSGTVESGIAAHELALARRYFRLLKWVDCWHLVRSRTGGDDGGGDSDSATSIETLLFTTKWSFMGIYLFLEMFTIAHTMRLTQATWGGPLQHEANRFWFLGIFTSLLLGLWQAYNINVSRAPAPAPAPAPVNDVVSSQEKQKDGRTQSVKRASKTKPKDGSAVRPPPDPGAVYKQLAIDGFDLLIPSAALQWIRVGPIVVGLAYLTSSLIAGRDIWLTQTKSTALKTTTKETHKRK